MTLRRVPSRWFVLPLLVGLIVPPGLVSAQQEKVAALKQSLAANQKQLTQYKWVETTVMSLKGEEKSRIQKQCFYGPDGKVQKQLLSAPAEQAAPGGVKGKIAAKKKEEISAAMKQAVALVQSYVPPDPRRIQAAKSAGNLAMVPTGPNSMRLDLRNYVKSGDTFSIGLDTAGFAVQTVSVKSYLESEKDAVTLDVTFARLRDGLSYPGNVVLNVPEQNIQVVVQNSNYQRVTPAAPPTAAAKPATAPAPAKPSASDAALDQLTGPIALYPDALVAQILEASKDVSAVQKFARWLKSNSALKGTELQDAAQKAGFAAPYIALAPFPQVVQTLVEKPDWTKQLGAAFTSDEQAVYQSIQRLRAAAMALGNLKTTPQQEVVTEASSTGQTIILVQPANPQVVYVPVYNTQTVYVQQAPPPSSSSSNVAAAALVGFTVGIIIGASSNHYYYGPYAWHGGGAAYHYAYERREDYVDHRQDVYDDRQDFRQDTYEDRQDYRQDNAPQNQAQRQSAAQTNQSQRQTAASSPTAQANQANRQSTAQSSQASRRSTASTSGTRAAVPQRPRVRGEAPAAPAAAGGRAMMTAPFQPVIVGVDKRARMRRPELRILAAAIGVMVLLVPACAPAPAPDRTNFTAPDEAAKALMKALTTNNADELKAIFGPSVEKDLSSGDPVSDRHDREVMALAMGHAWRWAPAGSDTQELVIGDEKWPLPIPLMKVRGGWQFDTDAGREEILSRRIGRNELRVIDVGRDYVAMQKAYASQPRDGKVAGLYAQKLRSAPGRQDGLYWRVGEEETPSPLGDLVEQAVVEGYDESRGSQPLWGYRFRVLTAQGAAANGGARSYIVNGEMSGGFALIAYPAEYGRSGIMTFIVNQDGVVYEKDLGEDTLKVAARLEVYDPDKTWAAVKKPQS